VPANLGDNQRRLGSLPGTAPDSLAFGIDRLAPTLRVFAPIWDQTPAQRIEQYLAGLVVATDYFGHVGLDLAARHIRAVMRQGDSIAVKPGQSAAADPLIALVHILARQAAADFVSAAPVPAEISKHGLTPKEAAQKHEQ
jgi:hypothetical protein